MLVVSVFFICERNAGLLHFANSVVSVSVYVKFEIEHESDVVKTLHNYDVLNMSLYIIFIK